MGALQQLGGNDARDKWVSTRLRAQSLGGDAAWVGAPMQSGATYTSANTVSR